jgi:hypothetical protein
MKNCNSSDAPFSLENNVRAVFHHRGGGRGAKRGGGGFFYFLPTFLCNLIRNCSDAPFSLGNDVRPVFHHRAHRDHRERALVRILGKEVWMRI